MDDNSVDGFDNLDDFDGDDNIDEDVVEEAANVDVTLNRGKSQTKQLNTALKHFQTFRDRNRIGGLANVTITNLSQFMDHLYKTLKCWNTARSYFNRVHIHLSETLAIPALQNSTQKVC